MESYLDGALTIETLGGDSAAGLFRAEDARGGVAWLARDEPFTYMHAVEFRSPGDRRGFHVHAGHRERLYIFSGRVRLVASRGGERMELPVAAGTMITFEPGVEHGLIAETHAFAVSFGTGTDPLADTTACPQLG